jgi:oligosaccharyltransferase complex subunit alpha (ribophorin I)
MLRTIEISHWGNIAVEETIDMHHTGAKLKGSFSRFDYMRKQGVQASVKSFISILPPNSADVYYRDEIGNISTSNLRKGNRQVELELRPRFPLFGGWKTYYTIGYNLPAYQALFSNGNDFMLKMKLVDHVYDDQLIEDLTVKIILPEHSKDFDLKTPYEVKRGDTYLHYTYLDTIGRPVIVLTKSNVVENHIQDFQLKYTYNRLMILQKPFVLIGAFLLLFTLIIALVRIDFTIDSKKNN